MASIAVIARISQMAIVTVFPQMNNLQFFLKFAENVYHKEKPNCICLRKDISVKKSPKVMMTLRNI